MRPYNPFNRTIVELKLFRVEPGVTAPLAFNRTIVELKHVVSGRATLVTSF